jgi:lysophospholipase L1-like esterase
LRCCCYRRAASADARASRASSPTPGPLWTLRSTWSTQTPPWGKTHRPAADISPPDQGADLAPAADGASADLGPLPALGKLTLVVNLGDSIAAGQGVAKSYADLLMSNDDTSYPAFKGKDLTSKYPGLKIADLAYGGATSVGLVNQATKAPANPQGNTLVVLSIGGNDIMNNFMALLDPAQTQKVAQTVSANIQKALAKFSDKTRYPGKVLIMALNVYEMTDGQGTFPPDEPLDIFCSQLRTIGPIFGKTLIANHGVYNQALEAAYIKAGVYVVDLREAFLGTASTTKTRKTLSMTPTTRRSGCSTTAFIPT